MDIWDKWFLVNYLLYALVMIILCLEYLTGMEKIFSWLSGWNLFIICIFLLSTWTTQ